MRNTKGQFIDGDKFNDEINNLECISRAENLLKNNL